MLKSLVNNSTIGRFQTTPMIKFKSTILIMIGLFCKVVKGFNQRCRNLKYSIIEGWIKMPVTLILAFIFAIFITVFAVLNSAEVIVKVPFIGQFGISQALVIIGSAAAGALIVLIFSLIKQVRLNLEINKHKKTIKEYKEKIQELENHISENTLEGTGSEDTSKIASE